MQSESKISFCVSDMNQRNEELGYKKVDSRFSCEAPGMERFFQDLLGTVIRECASKKGMCVCVCVCLWARARVCVCGSYSRRLI